MLSLLEVGHGKRECKLWKKEQTKEKDNVDDWVIDCGKENRRNKNEKGSTTTIVDGDMGFLLCEQSHLPY